MNLQPLRVFLPGKVMLAFLAFLGIVMGWYYLSSQAKADHLTKRNFNFLNQVAVNINASRNAAKQAMSFNSGSVRSCIRETFPNSSPNLEDSRATNIALEKTIKSCLLKMRERLSKRGPMLRDVKDMTVRLSRSEKAVSFDDLDAVGLCVDTSPSPSDKQLPVLVQTFQRSLISITPSGLLNTFYFHSGQSGEAIDKCDPKALTENPPAVNGHVMANVDLTIPFTRIEGFSQEETYFDAVVLARSDGEDSQVVFSNTETNFAIDTRDIRSLFSRRSGFERLNTLQDLEVEHTAQLHAQQTGSLEGKATSARTPFTQSTLVTTDIGGFDNLAFVQPFRFERSEYSYDKGLVLIGIVERSTFNKQVYAIPLNWLSYSLLLLLVGLLSMSFVRLKLIRERGIVHRSDSLLALISTMGIAALVVVFLVHRIGSYQFNDFYDRDLSVVHDWIVESFNEELAHKVNTLASAARELHGEAAPTLEGSRCELDDEPRDSKLFKCKASATPLFSTLFFLGEDGTQRHAYVTHLTSGPPLGFNLSTRRYFREIADRKGWFWPMEGMNSSEEAESESNGVIEASNTGSLRSSVGDAEGFEHGRHYLRYFMERIESRAEGSLETAMAMPVRYFPDQKGDGKAQRDVLVGLSKFESLEQTVVPPGIGFAVFENRTGKVLFHSDSKRSLREVFYRATDDDPGLKAAVVAGLRKELSLDYKGELIDAIVQPLDHTEWSLVTYHKDSIVDVVNFHFGVSAVMLAATYLLTITVVLPLIMLFPIWSLFVLLFIHPMLAVLPLAVVFFGYWRRRFMGERRAPDKGPRFRPPQWIYPMASRADRYRKLSTIYAVMLAVYILIMYFVDLPLALLTIAGLVVAAPAVWWKIMSPDEDRGASTLNSKDQVHEAYKGYSTSLVLLVLLVAVLPTMHLHNENYDMHEKLWVEYYSWSNVDRLRTRARDNVLYLSRFDQMASDGPVDFSKESWRGVYLPRTDIYTVDSESEAVLNCDPEGLKESDIDILLPRHPKLSKKVSVTEIEQTIHAELRPVGSPLTDKCFIVPGFEEKPEVHPPDPGDAATQSKLVRRLLRLLPDINDLGSLLESFIEREAEIQTEDDESVSAERTRQLLHSSLGDPENQLRYEFHNFYPHTRSINPFIIIMTYLLMAGISGMVAISIHRFLQRNFLAREFDEGAGGIEKPLTADALKQGAIVIVPAGYRLKHAVANLWQILEGAGGAPESPEMGSWGSRYVTRFEKYDLLVVEDFRGVISHRTESTRVLADVESTLERGHKVVILSDIDVDHWLYHHSGADEMGLDELHRWESVIVAMEHYMLPGVSLEPMPCGRLAYRLPRPSFREAWQSSSEDEQMVLAGLRYEGIVNPRNSYTLKALYRRRLIDFRNGHFEFADDDWYEFVGGQIHRSEFRKKAQSYKNNLWLAFRGPLLLALLVLVFFIAYVAQDEMKIAFSLLGTVGAGAATLTALGGRLRDLRSLANNSE